MDWSLLTFVLVVVFFAYRGYRNGLYKSTARISSILAGYASAIFFSGRLAALIESHAQWSGLVALIVAGLILFFAAATIVSLLFRLAGSLLPEPGQASAMSSVGGTAIGSMVGVLIAIVVVWCWTFARDIQRSAAAASIAPSRIELIANRAAGYAVNTAMTLSEAQPEVAGLSAALMSSPATVAHRARRLMQSDELISLLNDPENQHVLNRGDSVAVQSLPAFKALMLNPDLLTLAVAARLDGDGPKAMQATIARQLTDTWNRAQKVKNNRRVQEILADPSFQQQVNSGNPLALIGDSRLHELANIVFADDAPSPEKGSADQTPTAQPQIRSWTDSSGQLHITNQAPEN